MNFKRACARLRATEVKQNKKEKDEEESIAPHDS